MTAPSDINGAGGTTGAALTTIGSDLSVSITFQVAAELIDAASEKQISEEVLVGIVLALAVVFSALRTMLRGTISRRKEKFVTSSEKEAKAAVSKLQAGPEKDALLAKFEADRDTKSRERGVLEFTEVLVDIAVRISFGVSVQLLAASARARQTSRAARVMSLSGLGLYFLWLESGSEQRLF